VAIAGTRSRSFGSQTEDFGTDCSKHWPRFKTADYAAIVPPSPLTIVQHWTTQQCVEPALAGRQIVEDEPACFACGYEVGWKSWNKTRLERAHIIAHSIGGSDNDPNNFLLLCRKCHAAAPMTNMREPLLEWVANRPSFLSTLVRDMEAAFTAYGVTKEQLEEVIAKDPAFKADPNAFLTSIADRYQADFHSHGHFHETAFACLAMHVRSALVMERAA